VNRTRNATDFKTAFRGAKLKYEYVFRERIDKLRAALEDAALSLTKADIDDSLEYHARCYIINALLEALNWRLNAKVEEGLPNLVPEAAVRSDASGKRRFLDYLGFEQNTLKPLLVVEAKRLKAPLPLLATLPAPGASAVAAIPVDPVGGPSAIVSRGLAGEKLTGDWNHWLVELKDYIRSIHTKTKQVPKRVAMTNGEWFILFSEPTAFLGDAACPPEDILVYGDPDAIANNSAELYLALEHQHVLDELPFLAPVEVPFHVTAPLVRNAMHALRLRYQQTPAIKQPAPIIHVAPVVILRTELGTTIRVENPDPRAQFELPHAAGQLSTHLADVGHAAEDLLGEISERLQTALVPTPLEDHFTDPQSFDVHKAVTYSSEDEYFVVTGQHTHYLLPEPSVPDCPYHEWGKSNTAGVGAPPGPITVSNVKERSFFPSGETHHCAHGNVLLEKSSEITAENRARCGRRSGEDGEAFCEIWSFEQRLCCRTCAFERVCTKAHVFQLPCQAPVQIEPAAAVRTPHDAASPALASE
jgi:hypothetical protein